MKKIILSMALITAICFNSCNIDRYPASSMDGDEAIGNIDENFPSLLKGAYGYLKNWSDVMHRCGEYAGDNMMIRGTSTDAFYEFISFSRTPNNYRLQSFWDRSYKVIAQTSNLIKEVPEGKSDEIDTQLGECYYLRGMLYFYLCRAYGRPYYQNPEQNLGVPIVNGTPANPAMATLPDRSTVKETYEQAISDLKKAASLMKKDIHGEQAHIYASREAAWAMLSRIYLYMSGTYESPNQEYARECITYSDMVINSGKFSLLTREEYGKSNTLLPEKNTEDIFVIKRIGSEFPGYDYYFGIGGMYANIGGMGWGEMYASAKYLDLLNETGQNDWHEGTYTDIRAKFIEPQYTDKKNPVFRFIKNVYNNDGTQTNYNYVQIPYTKKTGDTGDTIICQENNEQSYTLIPVDPSQRLYSIQYSDGKTYQGVLDYEMKLNRVYPMFYIVKCSREGGEENHLYSPIISRLDEIYLNRAEANVKLGNLAQAMQDINTIRGRSIVGGEYNVAQFTAITAKTLVDKERQLELAYEAERSYDVFRNGGTLTRHYPGPHHPMVDIPATDYRVVYFIPQTAIDSYKGTLTQNPASN